MKSQFFNPMKMKSLKPKKKKDFRYWQSNLKPLGDWDKDNKINVLDCYPYDKNRQGLTEIKEKFKDFSEKRKEKKIEKATKQLAPSFYYLIVKITGDKWYNWGAFTSDNVSKVVNQAKKRPDVEQVIVSTNKNEASRRNRKEITKGIARTATHMKEGGEAYLRGYEKRQQFKENMKEGIKIRKEGAQQLQRGAVAPAGKPPSPPGWWRKAPPKQQVVVQQIPVQEEPIQISDEYSVEQRRLPPGVQQYAPISKEESYLPKRPFVAREYSLGGGERPMGMMPIIDFKPVRMPHLRFGRRIR